MTDNLGPTQAQAEAMADAIIAEGRALEYDNCLIFSAKAFLMGLTNSTVLPPWNNRIAARVDECVMSYADLRAALIGWLMTDNLGPTRAQAEAMADALIELGIEMNLSTCDTLTFAGGLITSVSLPPWNNNRLFWWMPIPFPSRVGGAGSSAR